MRPALVGEKARRITDVRIPRCGSVGASAKAKEDITPFQFTPDVCHTAQSRDGVYPCDGYLIIHRASSTFIICLSSTRRSVQETKAWDVFRTTPPVNSSLSKTVSIVPRVHTVKCLKVSGLSAREGWAASARERRPSVVLTAGVITKALVLLMTSQLKSAKKLPICKSDHQFTTSTLSPPLSALPPSLTTQPFSTSPTFYHPLPPSLHLLPTSTLSHLLPATSTLSTFYQHFHLSLSLLHFTIHSPARPSTSTFFHPLPPLSPPLPSLHPLSTFYQHFHPLSTFYQPLPPSLHLLPPLPAHFSSLHLLHQSLSTYLFHHSHASSIHSTTFFNPLPPSLHLLPATSTLLHLLPATSTLSPPFTSHFHPLSTFYQPLPPSLHISLSTFYHPLSCSSIHFHLFSPTSTLSTFYHPLPPSLHLFSHHPLSTFYQPLLSPPSATSPRLSPPFTIHSCSSSTSTHFLSLLPSTSPYPFHLSHLLPATSTFHPLSTFIPPSPHQSSPPFHPPQARRLASILLLTE
ncbi:hypothetical protein C7M84_003356 [Penaeus vannamei]|uniref:Uncharacterized protein n=1 Tax=Penaeus vannamei TaxID=6689 RepID=A0A423TNC0_PENVA|nr:hypothetical protein C7M84_003356 [Penaeus vannamei]